MDSARSLAGSVAIVGAGPVGMTMAALLAARGVSVVVVERRLGPSDEPKAISIDDEALRVYQQAGVLDAVLPIIVPGTGTRYYGADGSPVFHARAEVPGVLGFPFKNPFAQPDLERALLGFLQGNPLVTLRLGSSFRAIRDQTDGVEIDVESASGIATIEAKYLVGADGGRSTVRALLDIPMSGHSYDDVWLVVDTVNDPHAERFGMHYGTPARPHVIVPGLAGRCRYEFRLFGGECEPGQSPPFDLIKGLLSRYRSVDPADIERAVAYRFNGLNADSYGKGRGFLVGDAAHMMPPFAGQGLNSGIRDAANLSWKLAEVVAGRSTAGILDSYDAERRPQAGAVVRSSERLGRVVMTTSARLAHYRDAAVRRALETPDGRRFFEYMQYRPSTSFRDGLLLPGRGAGTALRQPRVFDIRNSSIVGLDEVTGPGWTILGVDVPLSGWEQVQGILSLARAQSVHVPLGDLMPRDLPDMRMIVDFDGSLEREVGRLAGSFVLLRPDHVIAAVWTGPESLSVERAISGWFTPEPNEPTRPRASTIPASNT